MAGGQVELVALTKRFAEAAVDDIDLTIASGEFFSLLGPSGCGKTTTLRLIAGFEQPTAGRILLDDVDVSGIPPHKRNVNTVFQSYALFPFLTVFDNVAFGLRNRKLGKAEMASAVNEALELVKLRSFAQAPSWPAFRRPAAAGGAGQGTGAKALGPAARRAARRAGCQAAPLAERSSSRHCRSRSASPSSTSRTTRRKR